MVFAKSFYRSSGSEYTHRIFFLTNRATNPKRKFLICIAYALTLLHLQSSMYSVLGGAWMLGDAFCYLRSARWADVFVTVDRWYMGGTKFNEESEFCCVAIPCNTQVTFVTYGGS
jgi:hypothetical protein